MHFRGTSNRIRNGRKRRGAKTTCGTPMLYKEKGILKSKEHIWSSETERELTAGTGVQDSSADYMVLKTKWILIQMLIVLSL